MECGKVSEELRCGICNKKFSVDTPVTEIIGHIMRHRKKTIVNFVFANVMERVIIECKREAWQNET